MSQDIVLLPALWASLVSAIVLILYGIFVEKHFVAFFSAVMNVIFGAVTLVSTRVPLNLYFIVLPYIVLGCIILAMNLKIMYFLFGTKTFGSFCLALWFYQIIPSSYVSNFLTTMAVPTEQGWNATILILIFWFLSAGVLNALAATYKYGSHARSGQRG